MSKQQKNELVKNEPNATTVLAKPVFSRASSETVYLAKVPEYAFTGGAQRKKLDAIAMTLVGRSPDAAFNFGAGAQERVAQVSQLIINAMQTEQGGVFRAPIQAAMDEMRDFNLPDLMNSVTTIVQKGAKTVGKNKTLSVATGLSLATGFWAVAAAGMGTLFIKQKHDERRAKTAITPEAIETRIRSAVTSAGKHVEALQRAQDHVPELIGRIDQLGMANRDGFVDTTLHLTAGREVLRRVTEEELPKLQARAEKTSDLDDQQALVIRQEFAKTLQHKLTVLELARAGAVRGTDTLAQMKESIQQNSLSLSSLLTTEVPQMQQAIATAGLALDTYHTTSVTEDFRNFLEQQNNDAVTATQFAHDAAIAGRIDNPERLERMVKQIQSFAQGVTDRQEQMENLDKAASVHLQELGKAVTDLLTARAEHTLNQIGMAPSVNDNQLPAPATQTYLPS